jgi:hypothetical protein
MAANPSSRSLRRLGLSSPLTFGGNGGANRQGADSFLEPTELESKDSRTAPLRCREAGFSSIASPVLDSTTGFFHVRVSMAGPRVNVLSLNCLGHVEKKRKLRPTAHNPCTRKTGLNGFVPASFLLGEALPTSRDRSVPILDAEQGCMVRHTKGTRSQLKPPLLSTPPFAPASCPRFGNLGTQGPGSWPHIPCLRIGALFGAAAAEKSSAATTSHKYTNSNPAFSRCCMGSHARATLIYTQAARSAVRALP